MTYKFVTREEVEHEIKCMGEINLPLRALINKVFAERDTYRRLAIGPYIGGVTEQSIDAEATRILETNRERARELYKNTHGSDAYEETDIPMIVQALDEAEERGQRANIEAIMGSSYREGQKEMRERAAKWYELHFSSPAKDLRALPIEGEK